MPLSAVILAQAGIQPARAWALMAIRVKPKAISHDLSANKKPPAPTIGAGGVRSSPHDVAKCASILASNACMH